MNYRNEIIHIGFLSILLVGISTSGYAQLISPGKLTKAHQNIEGLTNCTSCHALGSKGISKELCLNCHIPIKSGIENNRGFHATLIDQGCADCHQEHFGPDFKIVNWDTSSFAHRDTGYELIGKHMEVSCRSCHRPEYITDEKVIEFKGKAAALEHTFLGLGSDCETCHQTDSPHGDQFADLDCQSCHTPLDWDDLSAFNHDNTRYKLIGKHLEVSCNSCHRPVAGNRQKRIMQFTGIEFGECMNCHTDVHQGAMGAECSDCHTENGWNRLVNFSESTFNHDRTGFALLGKHRTLSCSSCHTTGSSAEGIRLTFLSSTNNFSYPHPEAENCQSCHTDYHKNSFADSPGGTECTGCHTVDGWLPTGFDFTRHNQETGFPLTGAHLAIPCTQCHQPEVNGPMSFHFQNLECQACHEKDNPHEGNFAGESGETICADCHDTGAWSSEIHFDHGQTRFPLTGAHALTGCNSCHGNRQASLSLPMECEGCHAADDPHRGQFKESMIGSRCVDCHNTDSFSLSTFDHSLTRFPLDGAHINLSCKSCHTTEKAVDGKQFVRFRPLKTTCESCHAN